MQRPTRTPNRWHRVVSLVAIAAIAAASPGQSPVIERHETILGSIEREYAYFAEIRERWPAIRAAAIKNASACPREDRDCEIEALESLLANLSDDHAFLTTNTPRSPRLVPSGIDIWPVIQGDRLLIEHVRTSSPAALAGLRPGLQIVDVHGRPAMTALDEALPRHADPASDRVRNQAARSLIARRRDRPIELTVMSPGQNNRPFEVTWMPGGPAHEGLLSATRLDSGLLVIRVHNALGDSRLIEAFDRAVDANTDAPGLVIDLRETPSGGNTTVARAIMSRLVDRLRPYQTHDRPAEERATGVRRVWVEHVAPRGERLNAPVAVLVSRWTGSMGEGLAIGLRDACDAVLIGSPMAGLRGAIETFPVPDRPYRVAFPTERLFAIDHSPRENARPGILVDPFIGPNGTDHALAAAEAWLLSHPHETTP